MLEHGHLVGAGLEAWLSRTDDGHNRLAGNPAGPRLGASVAVCRGRYRLALPRGFLHRWHKAEIPEHPWGQGPPSQTVLGRLQRVVSTGSDEERICAAEQLRLCGRHAVPALPTAMAMMADTLPAVRWRAVEILRILGPPEQSFPVLAEALRTDSCRSVRWRTAEALGARTLPGALAARTLIEAAQDDDDWVRWHACRVLSQVVDQSLLRSLLPDYAISSPVSAIKAFAIGLLTHADRVDEALLFRLSGGLRHPAVEVRLKTIELLTRHRPPRDRNVRLGLRRCLEDALPPVRARAVRAIGLLGGRGALAMAQSAFADPDPAVRLAVCEVLADGEDDGRARRRWLRHAMGDSRLDVRLASARALMRLGLIDRDTVAVLVNAVTQPSPSLEAWRALLALGAPHERASLEAAAALHPSDLVRLVAEDVAADTLPTIGLRLWPENARIRYPNKEGGDRPPLALGYPWANVGVFHSWKSHLQPLHSQIPGITKQICLSASPYPHAHLVAAVEFARHLPHYFNGESAPVHIEGRPVGSILEGTIGAAPDRVGRPRLDFVFGVDLQFCQYATFAASCSSQAPKAATVRQRAGQEWQVFVGRVSEVLDSYRLVEFSREQWFESGGWQSSRYGIRRERPYDEIRRGVIDLVEVLRSPQGKPLGRELLSAAEDLVQPLERDLWREKLSTYSPALRQQIIGLFGERCATCLPGEPK